MEKIDIILEDVLVLTLQNGIDQEFKLFFFEEVGNFLEQFEEGNSWLIVAVLGDLVKFGNISFFKDVFFD